MLPLTRARRVGASRVVFSQRSRTRDYVSIIVDVETDAKVAWIWMRSLCYGSVPSSVWRQSYFVTLPRVAHVLPLMCIAFHDGAVSCRAIYCVEHFGASHEEFHNTDTLGCTCPFSPLKTRGVGSMYADCGDECVATAFLFSFCAVYSGCPEVRIVLFPCP